MGENLVLISVDSLRADYCPWLSEVDIQTPTLTQNAESGVSYTTTVAPGQATPDSMPAVFSGYTYPHLTADNGGIEGTVGPHPTLVENLQAKGYETLGFSPNPFTSRQFKFDEGFDYFEDFLERESSVLEHVRTWIRQNLDKKSAQGLRLALNMVGHGDITVSWRDYYDEILKQVENADEPFFLWVFLLEPHWPYLPSQAHSDDVSPFDRFANIKMSRAVNQEPSEADQDRLRRVYGRTIQDVDDFVARIQEDLDDYDPIYVFHSDHGESLGERGNWGHKDNLYPENIRVPLEIWNVDNQATIDTPISLRRIPDILTSIAEGDLESWEKFCSPTAIARLDETEQAVVTEAWHHYPEGGLHAPDEALPLANAVYERNNRSYDERRQIREAAGTVSSSGQC